MKEDLYLLWLSSIDLSLDKKFKLMDLYGSAYNIWCSSLSSLSAIENITPDNIKKIKLSKDESVFKKYIDKLKQSGIRFVTINKESYPKLLKNIYRPPYWLYVRGEIPVADLFVSIIGSRNCSLYGSEASYKIAGDLAAKNVVVVSGMAAGIDTQAHKGAISVGGKTIAVFAGGIDVCYPYFNHKLMESIISNGCVISEFPLGYRPFPHNFRIRNRIISGLSQAVVVIEASYPSGTFITTGLALDQGRDVFAVPGNINSKNSIGTNMLIMEGAALVRSAYDILSLLGSYNYVNTEEINASKNILKDNSTQIKDDHSKHIKNNITIANDEKKVYDCVSLEPTTVDGIVYKTNLSIPSVQSILTKLLLKKLIIQVPGQGYVRSI